MVLLGERFNLIKEIHKGALKRVTADSQLGCVHVVQSERIDDLSRTGA